MSKYILRKYQVKESHKYANKYLKKQAQQNKTALKQAKKAFRKACITGKKFAEATGH